jgi:hypothetical protein
MRALVCPRGRVCVVAAGVALLLHGTAATTSANRETPGQRLGSPALSILVNDGMAAWRLLQAIHGAHHWLDDPACQEVFSDFTDLSGKLLSEVLAERGLTGQEQLSRLTFHDGSVHRQCQRPGIAALTSPGQSVIYICAVAFRRISRDRTMARAVVVHELLHSLGLGENPPSSREITAGVLERCD